MMKNWPAFLGGMVVAMAIVWAGYAYFPGAPREAAPFRIPADPAPAGAPADISAAPPAPNPDAVTIRILPTLNVLRGQNVSFQGRAEIPQDFGGRLVQEIIVVSFRAGGENAHKSSIRIAWEDGSVETIPAGAENLILSPQRRAKKITIHGYCFHEQRIFKDVPKKGTLSWEIRYAAVE